MAEAERAHWDPADVTSVHAPTGGIGMAEREAGAEGDLRLRPPAGRMALIALGTLIVGLWGGAVAYFGPDIGLSPAGQTSWDWSWTHTALNLMPGAFAVAAGLMMVLGTRLGFFGHRLGGVMAMMAGAWFVLGNYVFPVFYDTNAPYYSRLTGSPLHGLAVIAGYGAGVGVALCALGGMALAVGATGARPPMPMRLRRERRAAAPVMHARTTEPAGI